MQTSSQVSDFESIRLRLASPEEILEWSHGEVAKPETINYRTQRYEMDGLFCERIFGPSKDWECYCGKYRRIRYKGIVCDKCGVEVTRSAMRRERMGHIQLAAPVAHIWFTRGSSSKIGIVLGLTVKQVEKIVYFSGYIITRVDEMKKEEFKAIIENEFREKTESIKKQLKKKSKEAHEKLTKLQQKKEERLKEIEKIRLFQILSEKEYQYLGEFYATSFEAGSGAEALRKILLEVDIKKLIAQVEEEFRKSRESGRNKLAKRLRLLKSLEKAGIHPAWMLPTVIPVLPPDLRPMVQLDGGRFATSDLNDLYRRIINRNNRLKKLLELGAPEVISRNEKRMLQEAVDSLFDNSARRNQVAVAASTGQKRALRSLADMLKGKQGRFRQNLLGKRVDYSGRSVIVVGPYLKLHQCGIPKRMALELYKPFIISKLIEGGFAHNVRTAGRLIDQEDTRAYEILEEIISDHFVLLNRAPTLHRLSIQAFQPLLIEGQAIQIHPMVCTAFNADFDGDQMAVHVPLTMEARWEAKEMMLSSKNLLKPSTGDPITIPSQEVVLGIYYITTTNPKARGAGKHFSSPEEAIFAYQNGKVHIQAPIKVAFPDQTIETCIGRILLFEILPESFGFVNEQLDKSKIKKIVALSLARFGQKETVEFIDKLKVLGFEQATASGLSWSMSDLSVPAEKEELLRQAEKQVEEVEEQYQKGFLTESERKNQVIQIWNGCRDKIAEEVEKNINKEGPVFAIVNSKARGSMAVLNQLTGMRGLMVNPAGDIIELPVRDSFKEGLNVLEYFISTHGARKGMTDTALRTATAGYLTRRLVDVAQEVIVREKDCGDSDGAFYFREDSEYTGNSYAGRLEGRYALEDIKLPGKKNFLVRAGELISKESAEKIEDAAEIKKVRLRSVVNCKAGSGGICQKCYGYDLGKNELVDLGQAVGVVAAQAIGEPGTQLTMRTFHTGGVVKEDIVQGLPRVEEIFEARSPKGRSEVCEVSGKVAFVKKEKGQINIGIEATALEAKKAEEAAEKSSESRGKVVVTYKLPAGTHSQVEVGDLVSPGQALSPGSLDLMTIYRTSGREAVRRYIIREIQNVYASQGESIDDRHIEIIIKQMFSRIKIKEEGDTGMLTGEIISKLRFQNENREVSARKGKPAKGEEMLLGITRVSLTTESFLAAASFQQTPQVLIDAALTGKEDKLTGLKESVIIGKLIPAGTGFRSSKEQREMEKTIREK
ncbi:MAG: DNA-directed RNA polymerase subunit beta' [Candidatus Moranbacteria bacterium]|nr:DNA-directed RNA polymerase subunit beta' [Candidatus Moranbacteria bacterium]